MLRTTATRPASLLLRRVAVRMAPARRMASASQPQVVELSYEDLMSNKDLGDKIEQAYGPDGLGILTVSGVPEYLQARQRLLPLAQKLGSLPREELAKLEHEESVYQFGWSHGKEMFNGVPDTMKGSYYNNPTHDIPTTDPALIKAHPANCLPNVWPKDGTLPDLHPAFMGLGGLMVDVGKLVALQCDKYVASRSSDYQSGRIANIIATSRAHKARLLHYFPPDAAAADSEWCGWHTDHGSLTGLTCALFTDADGEVMPDGSGGQIDPKAGLYIRDRANNEHKVSIPATHIAFQLGESSQIHSGGLLAATPHYVRGPSSSAAKTYPGVARNTFAVFMQPEWGEDMAPPASAMDVGVEARVGVKSWRRGMDFSAFMKAKLEEYY